MGRYLRIMIDSQSGGFADEQCRRLLQHLGSNITLKGLFKRPGSSYDTSADRKYSKCEYSSWFRPPSPGSLITFELILKDISAFFYFLILVF
jgi:hypothetical protein